MKNLLTIVALSLASCGAYAQDINKCKIDGKTVYQQAPCPGADIKIKQVVVTPPKEVPYIGMSEHEIESSTWGLPMYKNKTTTATSHREQWVYYGHKYIYVQDGVVTAIQR